MKDVLLYDTSLRDGCQAEDVSFTLEDKLRIAEKLEELGIDYIEGGYPGSNPRDADFFRQVKKLKLKNAKIASFGTTRKPGAKPSQDFNLKVLLEAETPVVTLVGKTWDLHVRDDLRIGLKANLEIIAESIAYMKERVDEVIFDAEHFFDGYRSNQGFALRSLEAASSAGGACPPAARWWGLQARDRRTMAFFRRSGRRLGRGRRRQRVSRALTSDHWYALLSYRAAREWGLSPWCSRCCAPGSRGRA